MIKDLEQNVYKAMQKQTDTMQKQGEALERLIKNIKEDQETRDQRKMEEYNQEWKRREELLAGVIERKVGEKIMSLGIMNLGSGQAPRKSARERGVQMFHKITQGKEHIASTQRTSKEAERV